MVPRVRRPARGAEHCPLRGARSPVPAAVPPRASRDRGRARSRDRDGDPEAPLAAPLVRAARRRRRACPGGLRSPLPRRPGPFLICMGPAEFRFRQEPAPLSPPSRWARPSSPRSHGAALSPAHTRPDVAPRSGAEPPRLRPRRRGRGHGGRRPEPAERASAARPGKPAGARGAALPSRPARGRAGGGGCEGWWWWCPRPRRSPLPRPLSHVQPHTRSRLYVLAPGPRPRQPIAPGEHWEAVAAPCKSVLAALICRRPAARGVGSLLLPPRTKYAQTPSAAAGPKDAPRTGAGWRGMTHRAAFLLVSPGWLSLISHHS